MNDMIAERMSEWCEVLMLICIMMIVIANAITILAALSRIESKIDDVILGKICLPEKKETIKK